MLNFSEEHKSVDLSSIKSKLEKVGKSLVIKIGAILLSAVILFSGCSYNPQTGEISHHQETYIAMVIENNKVMLIELESSKSYDELSEGYVAKKVDYIQLHTKSGEVLLFPVESVRIIKDENSKEVGEELAKYFFGEDVEIEYYDEIIKNGKIK